jgi:uncharacterized membrane protein
MSANFPLLLLAMASAALICRMGGYVLMGLIPMTPRIEAALRATPLAVLAAITVLALEQGGLAEALALAAVAGLTLVLGNDVAAALLGVAVVALLRWAGM